MSTLTPKDLQEALDKAIASSGTASGITWTGTGPIYSSGTGITGLGLTSEEAAELKQLEEQYRVNSKIAKLNRFKKLDSNLRQFVINALMWHDAVEAINMDNGEVSDRLNELRSKDYGRITIGSALTLDGIYGYQQYGYNLIMPKDLNAEELKQAHIEACLEEQVLNSESNENTLNVAE